MIILNDTLENVLKQAKEELTVRTYNLLYLYVEKFKLNYDRCFNLLMFSLNRKVTDNTMIELINYFKLNNIEVEPLHYFNYTQAKKYNLI